MPVLTAQFIICFFSFIAVSFFHTRPPAVCPPPHLPARTCGAVRRAAAVSGQTSAGGKDSKAAAAGDSKTTATATAAAPAAPAASGVAVASSAAAVAVSSLSDELKAGAKFATTECPICLSEFGASDTVYITDCQHTFCDECITRCLKLKNECPLCRQPLSVVRLLRHFQSPEELKARDTVTVVVAYNKQRFEVELFRAVAIEDLFAHFADLFGLDPAHIKIVHRGKLMTKQTLTQAVLLSQPTFQLIGSVAGTRKWKEKRKTAKRATSAAAAAQPKDKSERTTDCVIC